MLMYRRLLSHFSSAE